MSLNPTLSCGRDDCGDEAIQLEGSGCATVAEVNVMDWMVLHVWWISSEDHIRFIGFRQRKCASVGWGNFVRNKLQLNVLS
jgi:hypothetical protein